MATPRRRISSVPKKYRSVPSGDFALGKGHYPINTAKRARNALSRISEFGTPAQKARVRSAVRRKYPSIKVSAGSRRRGK